jgi:hypothetical protein
MLSFVASRLDPSDSRRAAVAHRSGSAFEDGVIALASGEREHGSNVVGFKVRVVSKYLVLRCALGQKTQYVRDPNAKTTNARSTVTLVGRDGNPI